MSHQGLGQLCAAVSAPGEDIRNREGRAHLFASLAHDGDLIIRIGVESIESHNGLLAKRPDVLDVLSQVAQTTLHRGRIRSVEIRFENTAMTLESAHRRHQNHRRRVETRRGALDVEELLGSEIEAETGLGNDPVRMSQGHLGRDYRIAAVGDIGEGTTVHQGRNTFSRLHQIGH